MFWAAGLAKAVAAREYMRICSPSTADEAFAAGLFQDFAIPVMYAAAPAAMLRLLSNQQLTVAERIRAERETFRLDHAEFGRIIGQRLELPTLYLDSIAFHHQHETLREFMPDAALADAIHLASLLPHTLDSTNAEDAETINAFLASRLPIPPAEFLERVQKEFNGTYGFFRNAEGEEVPLARLLSEATEEMADRVAELVGTVHRLMTQIGALTEQSQHPAGARANAGPVAAGISDFGRNTDRPAAEVNRTSPATPRDAARTPAPATNANQRPSQPPEAESGAAVQKGDDFELSLAGSGAGDAGDEVDAATLLLTPRSFVPRANRLIDVAIKRNLSVAVGVFSVDHDICDNDDDPAVLCLAGILRDELTGPSHLLTRAGRGSIAFLAVGRRAEELRNHTEAIVCRLPVEAPAIDAQRPGSHRNRRRATTASAGVVWYGPGDSLPPTVNPMVMQARTQLDAAREAGGDRVAWTRPDPAKPSPGHISRSPAPADRGSRRTA